MHPSVPIIIDRGTHSWQESDALNEVLESSIHLWLVVNLFCYVVEGWMWNDVEMPSTAQCRFTACCFTIIMHCNNSMQWFSYYNPKHHAYNLSHYLVTRRITVTWDIQGTAINWICMCSVLSCCWRFWALIKQIIVIGFIWERHSLLGLKLNSEAGWIEDPDFLW